MTDRGGQLEIEGINSYSQHKKDHQKSTSARQEQAKRGC